MWITDRPIREKRGGKIILVNELEIRGRIFRTLWGEGLYE